MFDFSLFYPLYQKKCYMPLDQSGQNSRGSHITATAPLLNLNLNYEKLQCKYNHFSNKYPNIFYLTTLILAYLSKRIFSPWSSKAIFAFRSVA